MLQCVAVCDSVLQCVTVCYSALQCVIVRYSVWSVLQCVAACCSVFRLWEELPRAEHLDTVYFVLRKKFSKDSSLLYLP